MIKAYFDALLLFASFSGLNIRQSYCHKYYKELVFDNSHKYVTLIRILFWSILTILIRSLHPAEQGLKPITK